jgi:uncharacterized protein
MTNEERDIIAQFIARVGGAKPQQGGFASSVPSTGQVPALPPVDPEADQFIGQQFQQNPEARYRITQMAFVQEVALNEAQNRIKRLEWELDQARRQAAQAQQAQPQGQPQQSRGFFGGLFGGGGGQQPQQPQYQQPQYQQPQGQQYAPPPPPQPQYPPQYQPGMFQRGGGSGFLGSALTTAAGVAGGVVAGNALMDLFSGHHGGLGGGGGWGEQPQVNETIINNYGSDAPAGGDPWNTPVPPDQQEGGFWSRDDAYNQGGPDQANWDQGGGDWDTPDDGGFDDTQNV